MPKKVEMVYLVVGVCLFCLQTVRGQDSYAIDPNQSTIAFSVKHMVISTVYGKFTDYAGSIVLNESDLTKSSVNVTIKTDSLTTEVTSRDNDLRSSRFLDTMKYPSMTFASHRIQKAGDKYVMSGELSLHGVTKEVAIPFNYNGKVKDLQGKARIAVEGGLTIDRRDWGITYSKVLDDGGLVAGDAVKINLDIEAVKQ
jgi:polyisoprenoid-binding protein YceI